MRGHLFELKAGERFVMPSDKRADIQWRADIQCEIGDSVLSLNR